MSAKKSPANTEAAKATKPAKPAPAAKAPETKPAAKKPAPADKAKENSAKAKAKATKPAPAAKTAKPEKAEKAPAKKADVKAEKAPAKKPEAKKAEPKAKQAEAKTAEPKAEKPEPKKAEPKAEKAPAPKSDAKPEKAEPKKAEPKAEKTEAKKPAPKAAKSPAPEAPAKSSKSSKSSKSPKSPEEGSDDAKRRIDTPEIQEKIRELIKLAKEQDYLTYDDINEILPNDLVEPADVDAIMQQLRDMEFDIIDASEVDRFKDKKRDAADDEPDTKDQKLDILDDPVRMYLKQMGQVPLLTREQEVEISKRIEDAEIEVSKQLHLFGFVAEHYLELADKLNKGKERFDRVILDKKIESRERYMKTLPKLCEQLKQLHDENEELFRQLSSKAARGKKKLEEQFQKNLQTLHRTYTRFYFKQKVTEDFCEQVEDFQQKFWKYGRKLATDRSRGQGIPNQTPRTPTARLA